MSEPQRTTSKLASTDPLHAVQNGDMPHATSSARPETGTTGYALVNDPIYIITVAVFALITTGLPTIVGQFRFMPIIQALSLAVFLGLALRRGNLRSGLRVLMVWVGVQMLTMLILVIVLPPHLSERALAGGFAHRQSLLEWMYAAAPYPNGLLAAPVAYLIEFLGIVVGTLLTGGLVGLWFFMRLVNFTAFSMATMTILANGPAAPLVPVLVWNLLRLAGYLCLIPILAQPVLRGQWNLRIYWTRHPRLIMLGFALLIGGLLLEPVLTPLWPNLIPPE